jgi:hypothetical protein
MRNYSFSLKIKFWLVCLHTLCGTHALKISIEVPASQTKCYGEELAHQELLHVELTSADKISGIIWDPTQQIFSEKSKTSIQKALTTTTDGPHWVCIKNTDEFKSISVVVHIRWGAQAKDYTKVALKEHLDETTVLLQKAQDDMKAYHSNLIYMRQREERMRSTNESTATRLIGFCVFNVILMIGVGGWQMAYFKRFFRSKKIM